MEIPNELIKSYIESYLAKSGIVKDNNSNLCAELLEIILTHDIPIWTYSNDQINELIDSIYYIKIRTMNGKIRTFYSNYPYTRLVLLYFRDPDIINHPLLRDMHKQYINLLIQSQDQDGVFENATILASKLGVSKAMFAHIIRESLYRITSEGSEHLFSKTNMLLDSNKLRMKLENMVRNNEFNIIIPPKIQNMVLMLTEMNGNKYQYDYNEIADILFPESKNGYRLVMSYIRKIVNNEEFAKINEQGHPLSKSHNELIKVTRKSPKKVEKLSTTDQALVNTLTTMYYEGYYTSYNSAAKMLGISYSTVKKKSKDNY